ncbi:hypothetical protein K470DRAFT_195809, partial [Piedraia hortae CBS 480.64]
LPKDAGMLPSHWPWNHKIASIPGRKRAIRGKCPFSPSELQCNKKWVDDMLLKGFILRSTSPVTAPLFSATNPGGVHICHAY